MNNLSPLINFLGWAALTYCWLYANATFVDAIKQAIKKHNSAIHQRGYSVGYEDGKAFLERQQKESDDDADDYESET